MVQNILKEKGFTIFRKDSWLNDDKELKKILKIAKKRIFFYNLISLSGLRNFIDIFKRKVFKIKTSKVFLVELLKKSEYHKIKSLSKITKNPFIISTVKNYLGKNAKLTGLGLWYSKKLNIKYHKSQLFHLDKKGEYIKVFICLSNINASNGAFTFIDAFETKKFFQNKENVLKTTSLKFDDVSINSFFNNDKINRFTGSFGDITFCDTTRCLHQGSRVSRGYRIMLMMVFSNTQMKGDKSSEILI